MPDRLRRQGYVRVGDNRRSDDAVQWWYFTQEADGWAFARGGRVRTTRAARHALRQAAYAAAGERVVFLQRPEYMLGENGELVAINRSPYEATRLP